MPAWPGTAGDILHFALGVVIVALPAQGAVLAAAVAASHSQRATRTNPPCALS
jgi:hypothetical protein